MNQEKEIKLQKVDYLLPFIPFLVFAYPILLFGGAFFNWFDLENSSLDLTLIYVGVFLILSSTLWIIKLRLKKVTPSISAYFFGVSIGGFETVFFLVVAFSFLSLAQLTGTAQILWEVSLGFIWIVFVKISSDFHYFPQVYRKILTKYYQWFEVTTKE